MATKKHLFKHAHYPKRKLRTTFHIYRDNNFCNTISIPHFRPSVKQKSTTLVAQQSRQHGYDDIADKIEKNRSRIMAEARQLEDMGVFTYFTQNSIILLKQKAIEYGNDELLTQIETYTPYLMEKAQEGEQYHNPLTASQSLRYDFNLLGRKQNTPTQEQETNTYIPYPLRINTNENER